MLIACLYAPNGNPQPGPKFDYKLAWHDALRGACGGAAGGRRAGGAGGRLQHRAGAARHLSDELLRRQRAGAAGEPGGLARLLAQGWTDALRTVHPEGTVYTFWDYRRNRWERDGGMRLDHLLLSPELARRLTGAGVDRGRARARRTPATTRRPGSSWASRPGSGDPDAARIASLGSLRRAYAARRRGAARCSPGRSAGVSVQVSRKRPPRIRRAGAGGRWRSRRGGAGARRRR